MTAIPTEGFLGRLHVDDAQALMDASRSRRLPAGSLLFMEGDDAHTVLFLLAGQVKLDLLARLAGQVPDDEPHPGEDVPDRDEAYPHHPLPEVSQLPLHRRTRLPQLPRRGGRE